MKKSSIPIKQIGTILIIFSLLVGCAGLRSRNAGVVGKSTKAEEKAQAKVEMVEEAIVSNDREKLESIGTYAAGTDYALSKMEEPTREVDVARELNARILSLSGPPTLEQLKDMHGMVDLLVSSFEEQREKGIEQLEIKDSQIYELQNEKKELELSKNKEIKKYMEVAEVAAGKADQYAETLGEMDSWWGLGAIGYGIKKFLSRAILFIGIILGLYLVLRAFATTNPIAAAVFQIFDMLGSLFMGLLKGLAPGAAKIAKLVPESTAVLYKQTLGHIVDTIELLRAEDKKSQKEGTPLKKYSLEEILSEFEKAMDQPHKDLIDEVKKDVNWK